MQKASDYVIGDSITEKGYNYGRIVSVMMHPTRPLIFFLVFHSETGFSILSSVSDAACDMWVARFIPKEVMKRFLFDAFTGVDLPDVTTPGTPRNPILTVPTYHMHKHHPKVEVKPEVKPVIKPITDDHVTTDTVASAESLAEKGPMLPVLDWL